MGTLDGKVAIVSGSGRGIGRDFRAGQGDADTIACSDAVMTRVVRPTLSTRQGNSPSSSARPAYAIKAPAA